MSDEKGIYKASDQQIKPFDNFWFHISHADQMWPRVQVTQVAK